MNFHTLSRVTKTTTTNKQPGCSRVAVPAFPRQLGGFYRCAPILVPHSAHCAGRGDLTGTVWGGFGRARCCATTGALVVVAQCLVRRWIHAMRHSGWLLEEFMIFYVRVLTRLLSSIHVLPHIVDHGSGMLFSGFAGIDAPRAVFPVLPAVCRSMLQFFASCTWKSVHYFYESPVSFSIFSG